MSEHHNLIIESTSLVHTPGFIAWLKAVYMSDPKQATLMMTDLTNGLLTPEGARKVLSGEIDTTTVQDQTVSIVLPEHLLVLDKAITVTNIES